MSESAKGEERVAHKVPPRLSGVCYETEFHICCESRRLSRKLQHKAAQKKEKGYKGSGEDAPMLHLSSTSKCGIFKKISNKLLTHSFRSVFPFLRF